MSDQRLKREKIQVCLRIWIRRYQDESMQAQFYKILGKYFYESHRKIADGVIFIISNLALFITKIVDIIKNLLFLALGIRELKQRTIIVAPIERLIDKCMGMM